MNQITVTVAPPMSQSTALVLSLSRAGAARSARSYLLLSIRPFLFPFIRHGLCLSSLFYLTLYLSRHNPAARASLLSPTELW